MTLYWQGKKPRHGEINSLILGHIANAQQHCELGSGPMIPWAMLFLFYSAAAGNFEK